MLKAKSPSIYFWVGSAGAFDDRYKKVTRSFIKILTHLNINYAVLGVEESSSGDIARRAGNEMLFQMQAMTNIEIMNSYEIKRLSLVIRMFIILLKMNIPNMVEIMK